MMGWMGWLNGGTPLHRLILVLAGSLIVHGLFVLLAGWFPQTSLRESPAHVLQASLNYHADPVALDEAVVTKGQEVHPQNWLNTGPNKVAPVSRAFTHEPPQWVRLPAEQSPGLSWAPGPGDDCRAGGFRFCSS